MTIKLSRFFLLISFFVFVANADAEMPGTPSAPPQGIQETQRAREDAKILIDDLVAHSTLAGSFKPVLRRVLLSKTEAQILWQSIKATVHWEDMALLAMVGWLCVPALQLPYSQVRRKPFTKSKLYVVADHLQQIAKIALAIYIVDIFKMTCIGLGFEFCKADSFAHAFAQGAYTVWAANRLSRFKKYMVRRYVSTHPDTYGRMHVVNRLADAAIYAACSFVLLNILKVEMGVAMHSFLAFGSVGTLALGLASQGITTQILNGLMLATSDRIYEGDTVRFGNGLSGTIQKLGWLETVLRGSDEIMVSVPNTDLLKQQVSNLSRIRLCQVKQTLKFKFKDSDKLPQLMETIKSEIEKSCPSLITDGSRPFRAVWTEFGPDHLQVMVEAHFRIRPIGDEYWNNRQNVLQAIDRAVKIVGVEFA